MEKPVIILGGGIQGSLLAWRLKQALPQIPFRLYEEGSSLGHHLTCSFRESDCSRSMPWLRPLISNSWKQHHIKFANFEKWVTNPYHLIDSRHLHEMITKRLGGSVRLNDNLSLEYAQEMSSFVIDARDICHYKKSGHRKFLSLEVELTEEHNLIAPVIYDGNVVSKEKSRSLYYLPLSPKTILVKDIWFSDNNKINIHEMRESLCEAIQNRGWKIYRILREEIGVSEVPISDPVIQQEGRVINLAGLAHDTTGCAIPFTTKLIDRMVATSFRYGELREVVNNFRKEHEADRKFCRFLNKQLIEDNHPHLFETIYQQPYSVIERFSRGQLGLVDRSRIALGNSQHRFSKLMCMVLPYNMYPSVEYRPTKVPSTLS